MIYLKKHNLLFVKPLKTASTSVEIAFACDATPDDIVTPISIKDELLRFSMGGQLPVNYSKSSLSESIYRARVKYLASRNITDADQLARTNARLKAVFRGGKRRVVYNHIKPSEIMKRKGESFFRDSFVVTMCRHPYDVLVSRVFWERFKKGITSAPDTEKLVDEMLDNGPLNYDYYFLEGEYLPDLVIKYEALTEGLAKLDEKFGLNLVENLPFTKNKVRKKDKDPRDLLTERQKARCYDMSRPIFEKFGYEK